jgi:hypothetical protein
LEPELKISIDIPSALNNFSENSVEETSNFNIPIVRHDDNLRVGSFKYTIINDAYVNGIFNKSKANSNHPASSSSASDSNSNYFNMAHVRLPHPNEAICVDNLFEFKLQFDLTSYVCWRYVKPRALTFLKILPLPFLSSLEDQSVINNQKADDTDSSLFAKISVKPAQFKCHLEYLNECSKKFTVLKEFFVREDSETIVIEKFSSFLANSEVSFSRHFVYAKVWRIRLSTEAKRAVYASSLLASTIVDSIELNQQPVAAKSNSNVLNVHLELAVSNIELKLNSIHLNTNDLMLVNVSDFSSRVLVNRFEKLTTLTANVYAQLGVDYCEYKFLTVRPMIDPFQFKVNSKLNLAAPQTLFLDVDVDSVNVLISQSGLVALKQLESEWKIDANEVRSPPKKSLPHYYLIHNDTSMLINVKQYDTEETCPLRPGEKLNYTWRTHKKSQLVQLFIKQHRIVSQPFRLDKNGVQEVEFMFLQNQHSKQLLTSDENTSCYITCIVHIETKYKPEESAFRAKQTGNMFKKYILIQSKFSVCNYLNLEIERFDLSYSFMNRAYDVSCSEPISKLSRANSTFELFGNASSNLIEVQSIRINDLILTNPAKPPHSLNQLYVMLQSGVLCTDRKTQIKYWTNISEQTFNSIANPQAKITQFSLTLTPVFVFCSYLPYDLNIEFLNKTAKPSGSNYLIKSNSISFCSSQAADSNELMLKFDHMFKNAKSVNKSSPTLTPRVAYLESMDGGSRLWYEQNVSALEKTASSANFNVSTCESDEDRTLLYAHLFDHAVSENSTLHRFSDNNEFSLGMIVDEHDHHDSRAVIDERVKQNYSVTYEKESEAANLSSIVTLFCYQDKGCYFSSFL